MHEGGIGGGDGRVEVGVEAVGAAGNSEQETCGGGDAQDGTMEVVNRAMVQYKLRG